MALNLFNSRKHNSHSKKEKLHEKSSKNKFSYDKQEQLSNDEHEFVKRMCIFCRQNNKTKFCDMITKPEICKEVLFKERRCFICMKKGHSGKQCRNIMKCFKCSGRHHVAVCTFQNRDSGNPLQPQEDHSTTSNLINVPKNDSIFLQTARSEISSVDKRNCQNFRILFDNGSQLSYISPQAAKNLSFKALGKKEIVVKIFGNVKALKKLYMLPFAVKSKDENLNTYIYTINYILKYYKRLCY